MQAKRVIRQVVPWREARQFFYWRLKRKLLELSLLKVRLPGLLTRAAAAER